MTLRTKNIVTNVEMVNGYEIVRCEEITVDDFGNKHGRTKVFYDVCVVDGDILESFKRKSDAVRYAKA